jgi:hypothetical protein
MNNPSKCEWVEVTCEKPAKKGKYCLKHYSRGVLLDAAKEKGVRICDDGKRACRNETFNSKLKCEECLKETRVQEMEKYNERKEKGLCTMCGKELEKLTKGIKENFLQKCAACYSTMRKVEDKRVRDRNYAFEKKINPMKHFREYADSAAKKNVEFNISVDEFTNIVTKPCYYCKKYDETEVIGIDRIDSFKGYATGNILPACEICNSMKKQLTMKEFANHISILYKNFASEFNETQNEIQEAPPSYRLRPAKILEHYYKKTLDTYIELCKADNRSAAYIQKLIDATSYTMTNNEFRDYLENASRIEVRSQQLTLNNERKRVPRNEIFPLLKNNKPIEVVKLYESVFGKTAGIRDDMIELAKSWNTLTEAEQKKKFDTCVIKYNNMRSYRKKTVQEPLVVETVCSSEDADAANQSSQNPLTHSQTISTPVQWKISNIYKSLVSGNHAAYLRYLQENNRDAEERLNILITSIKDIQEDEAKIRIKAFIEELRTVRHNALCYSKNDALLLREDREHWNSQSVLRAFAANMLEKFKEHTEANTGESADDPVWCKRWEGFVESVSNEADLIKKKGLIRNFLTAQRTKKYRKLSKSSANTLTTT